MNKYQFNLLTNDLENPTLTQSSVKSDLLNCHFIISGKHINGLTAIILLPGAKQLKREQRENSTKWYYRRVRKYQLKYERWLHDLFGNYCRSELSIRGGDPCSK